MFIFPFILYLIYNSYAKIDINSYWSPYFTLKVMGIRTNIVKFGYIKRAVYNKYSYFYWQNFAFLEFTLYNDLNFTNHNPI